MKKVFMIAMFAIFNMGTTMWAQSSEKGKDCSSTEKCCSQTSANAGCTDCHKTPATPFDGLELTEEQQAKISEIKATFGPKKKACLEEAKKHPEKQPESCQLQRDCMAKMKKILTPEQYVTFLENLVAIQHFRK